MPDRTDSIDNRRDQSRQPIELKVEYKRLNSFFSDYTRNISKGGTFIRTSKPLDVGTEFVFKLHVPTLDTPMRIRGRVQWVVTQDDLEAGRGKGRKEPGMGIRFVYREPGDKAAIERQVESVMVESLGQRLTSKLMEYARGESDEYPGPFAGQTETFSSSRFSASHAASYPLASGARAQAGPEEGD